jgi:hypothetical protein
MFSASFGDAREAEQVVSKQPREALAELVAANEAYQAARDRGGVYAGLKTAEKRAGDAWLAAREALASDTPAQAANLPLIDDATRKFAEDILAGEIEAVTNHGLRVLARAALAQAPEAAPQPTPGWKLVPVEPTREMLDAYVNNGGRFHSARSDWAAMIAAAPTPGVVQAVEPVGHLLLNKDGLVEDFHPRVREFFGAILDDAAYQFDAEWLVKRDRDYPHLAPHSTAFAYATQGGDK